MKAIATTQRNTASTLHAHHSTHNVHSPLRRLTLLVTLLMTFALGARAQNYYVFLNGSGYYLENNNGSPRATTTFSPSCVWIASGTLGNTSRSLQSYIDNSKYLRGSTNSLAIGNSQSNWRTNSNYLRYGDQRYIGYQNNNFTFTNRNYNSSRDFRAYSVTITTNNGSEEISFSVPSVTINPTSADIMVPEDVTFTATATESVTQTTSTQKAYTTFRFNNTDYLYEGTSDEGFGQSLTAAPEKATTTKEFDLQGYNYTLSDNLKSCLEGSSTTNSITYASKNPEEEVVTGSITVTPNYGNNEFNVPSATATITVRKKLDNPTGITAEDMTLIAGETATMTYTLYPSGAYDKVAYDVAEKTIASINLLGVVTAKKAGSTQFTITAYNLDDSEACSTSNTITVLQRCATPTIHIERSTKEVTITCSEPADATIYYTTDGTDPTIARASQEYTGSFTITGGMVKAIAVRDGWADSHVGIATLGGNGENAGDPYFVASVSDLDYVKNHSDYHFQVVADFDASGFSETITKFSGTFDGGFHTISGLNAPLFASTDGAIIKNVVLDSLNITGGTGNVGAIAGTASGATRIYNCGILSGTIGGGTYVGSIAGMINDEARVINCYSFANITGGTTVGETTVGGIVGYNSVASTANNLKTLVMNCMYYGDITGDDDKADKAPIYNGEIISNAGSTGINNYNYYRYESDYSKSDEIDTYNCALAAEERYLTRHEFYRNILNSQRKLCAFYVTNSISNKDEIGKWVIDKTIAPYPIIKPWGKYPSTINKEVKDEKILGSLSVTISGESATPQTNLIGKEITLDITDMDADNHDYNYYKVQLPYYNDYYSDNYTNNRVVTGWKITEVEGDNTVEYAEFKTTGNNAYNYADRYCIDKDLYSKTGIVFAQGGYYNVPEGVTSITIEPYWGKAVYLSDANYDEVYSTGYAGTHYAPAGTTPNTFKEQTVYKSLGNVWRQLTGGNTVYDNAIVLVGNYHSYNEDWDTDNKPFTIMSVDEDGDNEPDYCLYQHFADRKSINPARFDFLYIPALAMAAKVTGSGMKMPNQGIYHPKGWLEITETSLIRFTEFEYDNGKSISSPIILNNGLFEQFVSSFGNNATNTNYIRLGGNIYFESYTPGTHTDKTNSTKRSPLTITGGEYKALYLSGEKATANTQQGDALCYSNGGYIHTFASAYMENIDGNVTIKMDHSIIEEFYGGGLKESTTAQIAGNINVTINNSVVDFYCGGPKFGRVATEKTIITNATGTTFGEFYGAGYGGTSYTIIKQLGNNGGDPQGTTYAQGQLYPKYTFKTKTDDGILVNYHLDFFTYAGGLGNLVSRFFNHYAKLSLAQTNNVTSTLVNCTVKQDFYGGGCLGAVEGDVTSTLTNCNIMGSAFAGGFSASIPTSMVRKAVPGSVPTYNPNSGVFNKDVLPAYEEYSWSSEVTDVDDDRKLLPTSQETLNNLGKVTGKTQITINGNSQIHGSVFGGGNASKVIGNTHVHIQGGTIDGNVFGAGNEAEVDGKTEVIIGEQQVTP